VRMHCPSVFEKCYWRPRDKARCDHRGRTIKNCPASAIVDKLLAPTYGPDLLLSGCESSTSLIIRPDPFFGIFRQRAARQSFIFERQPVGDEDGLSMIGAIDVRCPSQDERKKFLRSDRWREALYCAAGYLRPPSYMTGERGYHIPLLDFYSTHSGLLPFLCTPYVSHHGFFGYVCAQAAVYLCLEMMVGQGATPHSPATINHILSRLPRAQDYDPQSLVATCKIHAPQSGIALSRGRQHGSRGFYNRAMYEREFEDLFENGRLGTRGLHIGVSRNLCPNPSVLTALHLRAMLDSRIPVIAVVDFNTLARSLLSDLQYDRGGGHVVTIVGYARKQNPSEFTVVFHDGHLGAYRQLSLLRFMEAASLVPDDGDRSLGPIEMYSPLPLGVSPERYRELLDEVYWSADSGVECSIRLLRVGSLQSHLLAYAPGQSRAIDSGKLGQLIKRTRDEYIWLVEYRDGSGTLLDLVDAGQPTERRLGVLWCGADTQSESWMFCPAEGDARSIAWRPCKAKGMTKGTKGACIKLAVAEQSATHAGKRSQGETKTVRHNK
jgi:hypothetical protein